MTQAYEERFLFLLLLLRQPRLRMIYVTSLPIAPAIVEYYLALLPGVIPSHARARLSLVSVDDSSPRPLSQKLLERPAAAAPDRGAHPRPARSHLVPYNTTRSSVTSRWRSGIPMYGADPRLFPLGTKTGCRRLFAEAGVRAPARIRGPAHARRASLTPLLRLRAARPTVAERHRQAQRGRLRARATRSSTSAVCPRPGAADERAEVAERARGRCSSSSPTTPLDAYLAKLAERGGIVEERIAGDRAAQPERAAAGHAARRGRAAVHPRPAARRAERAELPRLPVPGRLRATPGDQRGRHRDRRAAGRARVCWAGSRSTSSSCRTRRAPGRRTPSSSTSARAARRTRS